MKRTLSTLEEWSIGHRFLEEIWLDATAAYWERRACQLEAARPRPGPGPGGFTGQATHAELVAQYDRLTEAAKACRTRGEYLDATRADFDNTLADIAGDHSGGTAA